MSSLTIRFAAGEADAKAIFRMLINMHDEVGRAPLNPGKAFEEVCRVVFDEAAWIVEQDGAIVGTMGLFQAEHWYSDETFLTEQWFYVAPAARPSGLPFAMMLDEAKAFAQSVNMQMQLLVFTPDRKAHRNGVERIATKIAYAPAGRVIAWSPDHVR